MGWRKKMRSARRLHRPSLKDWSADGLYQQFPQFVTTLQDEDIFVHPNNDDKQQQKVLPVRIDVNEVSVTEFWNVYERTNTPCVIDNIPTHWAATTKWTADTFNNDTELRERYFKCGEDDNGKSIKVRLKYFLRYMKYNQDDSPLYIFDTTGFDNDKYSKQLLRDYSVPPYFNDDLFRFISESRRPPYRWILVGPERSGSCVHIDPLASNAWNTLLVGRKRWVLFPPHVPKRIVKGNGLIYGNEDDEAIHYFMTILPRIKRKATRILQQQQSKNKDQSSASTNTTCSSTSNDSSSTSSSSAAEYYDYKGFCCYEFTQQAGQTVFVPHGWWHAVLNLCDTVGVTQNYVSPRNFLPSWKKTRSSRKRMAWKWLCELEARDHYKDLARQARRMNTDDQFRMKYDPTVIAENELVKKKNVSEQDRKKQRRVI